jgi:hypothetical protein
MVKCCGFVEYVCMFGLTISGTPHLGKRQKKWKFAKNLVQSAEFLIIWRFAFPDVIVASDRVA